MLKPVFSFHFLVRLLLAASFAGLLQSCATSGSGWDPDSYTVKSGDTVFSVAWRYELDPVELARWNNIDTSSFLIRPGQRLRVKKPSASAPGRGKSDTVSGSKSSSMRQGVPSWVKVRSGDTLYGLSRKYGVSVSRLAQLNQLKKPYVLKPGQTLFLKPLEGKSSASGSSKGSSANRIKVSRDENWAKHISWQWPVKGKILSRFKRNTNNAKGIDIAGRKKTRINAAAAGKVVYSGNGLISYGNLVIIKHNKTFLSAYAYNHKLLVKEGQRVKAGQQIAEMGQKDNASPRLHFEIRRNGKPVDPLRYLP